MINDKPHKSMAGAGLDEGDAARGAAPSFNPSAESCCSSMRATHLRRLSIQSLLTASDFASMCRQLKLSSREAEITYLILLAHSERCIAHTLHISTHTVHSHTERLYRKLDIGNRSELITCLFQTYLELQAHKGIAS
jgi:DNA-binding NarL/FixJ family response regulator